jgi:hypothetical protein
VVQFAAQHHFHQLNLRQLAGFAAADKLPLRSTVMRSLTAYT